MFNPEIFVTTYISVTTSNTIYIFETEPALAAGVTTFLFFVRLRSRVMNKANAVVDAYPGHLWPLPRHVFSCQFRGSAACVRSTCPATSTPVAATTSTSNTAWTAGRFTASSGRPPRHRTSADDYDLLPADEPDTSSTDSTDSNSSNDSDWSTGRHAERYKALKCSRVFMFTLMH